MSFTSIKAGDQLIYTSTKMLPVFTVTGQAQDKNGQLHDVGQITHNERQIYCTRKLEVQESSLLRRVHVLACSIFHDMWVSLCSSIGSRLSYLRVRIQDENTAKVDNNVRDLPELASTAVNSTIQSLRIQSQFHSIGVDTYCKVLEKNPDVQYIPNCLVKGGLPTKVKKFPPGTATNLLIPVVLKGLVRDHIVCIYIQRSSDNKAVIEFYDSKGLTIADRANETLVNNPSMTLSKLVAQLSDHYCDGCDVTIKENTTKHQSDSHNCGIYVCQYFKSRINGIPADEIQENLDMDYSHTFDWRKEMIEDLMDVFEEEALKIEEVVENEKTEQTSLVSSDDEFFPDDDDVDKLEKNNNKQPIKESFYDIPL